MCFEMRGSMEKRKGVDVLNKVGKEYIIREGREGVHDEVKSGGH